MRYSVQLVNPSFSASCASNFSHRFALFAALRCEGQNYSKRIARPQGLPSIPLFLHPVALP